VLVVVARIFQFPVTSSMTRRPRDIYSEATVYKIIHTSGAKKSC